MRKRGYTIIECIVTINISLLIIAIFLSNFDFDKKIKYKIESEFASSEFYNILTYSKLWCKNNKKTGEIRIDTYNNEILFYEDRHTIIRKVTLPKSIEIWWQESRPTIVISSTGRINKATTIIFYDKLRNMTPITIRVGVDKITIKKEKIV